MSFTNKKSLSITSSHDSEDSVERMRPSANKRISALNVHEDRILRRKINAYHKIHKKEIAEVSSRLVEIRESMKGLATDPLYGNHSLQNVEGCGDGISAGTPVTSEQKLKLGRSQSFPDLGDRSTTSTKTNKSSFPISKHGHHVVQNIGNSSGRALVHREELKPRMKSTGSPQSIQINKWQLTEHKKLERCKTAPVTMLQPLLITTPEMIRKKINISTSSRLVNIDEVLGRRRISSCLVETDPKTAPMHSPHDSESYVHRPKSTSDAQASHSFSNDSKTQFNIPSKKMLTKREASEGGCTFSFDKNDYEQESSVAASRSTSKNLKTVNWK